MTRLFLLLPCLLLLGCPADPTIEDVYTDVFIPSCAFSSCHGDQGAGGLSLASPEDAEAELIDVASEEVDGEIRVIPGDVENSMLWKVLQGPVGLVGRMPPSDDDSASVTEAQMETVRAWIESGAL